MSLPSRGLRLSLLAFGLFYSVPSFAYRMAAWAAPWDPNSLTSIQLNAGRLSESNPVWYSLDWKGNIVKNAGAEDPTWRAAMIGTEIIPTLQNRISGTVNVSVTQSLISSKRRSSHAQAITNLVVSNGYDGIDIDYEELALSDRPNYTAFIQILASMLHSVGKKLSVVVSPKTSDAQNWSGPGGEDYAAIAAAADQMKIMCYDFHWATSSAGPIAPLDWVDSVATYAESVAPSSRIIIGNPWYGYDWVGSSATSVSYQQAMNTAAANGATVSHDVNGEATYTYGGSHIVYFQDAFSYNTKMNMLVQKHRNLLGFAHWVAGVEDPNIWTRVAALKNGATQASVTTVASSLNPSTFRQIVTFTAAVTGSGAIPTGTVSFNDGSLVLGTATLGINGNASFSTSGLGAGTHSIAAAYSGDATFMTSASTALAQSVAPAATASQLSSNVNPSSFGQTVTLTASVSSTAGVPSGSVSFFDGVAPLGSATLSNGQASINVSLTVGSHVLTAQYSGDANFAGSSAGGITQTVNRGASTTSLVASPSPSTFGQAVVLTAKVSGAGATPTGSVTFFDGATTLASASLVAGNASFSATGLNAGSHSFSAQYSGDGNFIASTAAALAQTVNPAATSTSLAASPNPSILNQAVTLTSAVTSSAGVPSGSVTFFDGASALGSVALDANGQGSLAVSTLTGGSHSLTAQYQTSANFASSTSAAITQKVSLYTSSTTLTSAANPSTYGSAVTLTASVASSGGSPTGTVTFQDGTIVLGTATLTTGQATLIAGGLAAGTHSLTAVYGGDATFNGSTSAAVSQIVNKANTSTAIASSLNPSGFAQSVTLTASISSSAGAPTGSVTFLDGASTLGTATVSGGTASLALSTLGVGPHSIVAQYAGDANFNASISAAITQTVNVNATTTALTASPNPSSAGATVTLIATVTASNATPGGSVTFKDGSSALGSQTLDASGKATFTTSTLLAGTHSITAAYGGTIGFGASVSGAVAQVVNAAAGYKTAVWIAPWMSASLTSVQLHAGSLTESNPVWYTLDSSGSPVADPTTNSPTWRAAMTGTLIVPTIQNYVNGSFSKTVVENLISTATSRDAHAQVLTNLAINNAYDGIDLDYESLSLADRSNFTAFVTVLASKLHAAGKLLSLTLSAKTSDSQTWDGPGADDYTALGPLGDSIKLMIYDYHWSTSAPGPLTPLDWLDGVLTYAESTIPKSKIIAGLPWYGYDWIGSSGTGVGYQQAVNTATAQGATITHDVNGEATYTYSTHTVYFQDAYAYDQKVNVVKTKHPMIGGFVHWVAGDEDPAIWTRVAALKNGL